VVERRDNDYFDSPVNRAARIMTAAGGQMLLSRAVVDLCVWNHRQLFRKHAPEKSEL
jgi:class 3 adenylate cyclase